MKLKILDLKYHRNGVGGIGFAAMRFIDLDNPVGVFLGTVFLECDENDEPINDHYAVVLEGDVRQAWRGDCFVDGMKAAIQHAQENDFLHGSKPAAQFTVDCDQRDPKVI